MMEKTLLFFTMIVSVFTMNAQDGTGSISDIGTIPSTEIGASTGNITITYTSDVTCSLNVQLRETNPGETAVNWTPWYGDMTFTGLTAGTDVTTTFSYNIPGTIIPTEDLPNAGTASEVQWVFAMKLVGDPTSNSYAYNDAGNIIEILPSSTVFNNITITNSLPSTAEAETDVTVEYEYTLADAEGNIKIEIRSYEGEWGWDDDGEVAVQYGANPIATTTITPVTGTAILTIPEVTTPTADMTGDADRYYVLVTLNDSDWTATWLDNERSLLEITAPATASLEDVNEKGVVLYPNPVSDRLMINANLLDANSIMISDVLGRTIRVIDNTQNIEFINVSDLTEGVYILTTDTKKQFKFLKN